MSNIFEAPSSTEMASLVYPVLEEKGVLSESRNGRVKYLPGVTVMTYQQPYIRGNLTPHRDANPFFHVAESMWMLAGRDDLKFLSMFNANMGAYSDDGVRFNAAYGHRLRHHFGHDQLKEITHILSDDPGSRQMVCQIWDSVDLAKHTKDKACNMSLVFSVEDNAVNMTVFNRSNDAVYGAITGANPVHMSYFLQWVADRCNMKMGTLTFVSNNLHVYLDLYSHWGDLKNTKPQARITRGQYFRLGSLEEIEELCREVEDNLFIRASGYSEHITKVVKPIINAFLKRKFERISDSQTAKMLLKCEDKSLRLHCFDWLSRRKT